MQPETDDTAILDKGSETLDVTEKGETKLNSDTKYFDLPTIKVANGDGSYPPNKLETNIGDRIIGTNDFTIETFIKFDDVKQDQESLTITKLHAIVHHGYCIIVVIEPKQLHRSETLVVVGSSGWLIMVMDQHQHIIDGFITFHFCHQFRWKTIHGITLRW